MIWDPSIRTRVYVVDAGRDDYSSFLSDSQNADFEVVFFSSGSEALRAAAEDMPSIWIVNLQLPDMSGADLQSLLRKRGCTVPIALVSNEYRINDELEARRAGADLYFVKPIQSDVIFAAA